MNAGAEARIRQAVAELADAIVAAVDDGPPPAPDRLYDVGEAATTLGIQRSKLYGLMPPGELCSVKVGRRRLVPGRRHRRVRCPGGQRMSRDDGFGIADMDGGLLNDAKVHQLIRATRHEGLVARCLDRVHGRPAGVLAAEVSRPV